MSRVGLAARALLQALRTQREREALTARFPHASVHPSVTVICPERLSLGEGVLLQQGSLLHCGGQAWSAGEGTITVGAGSAVAAHNVWYGAGGIEAGERLDCGPGVMIFSSQTDHRTYATSESRTHRFSPVRIGDDVILYAGCIVTPGVQIGAGAVVAAGAVVTADVPPGTLCGGVPARALARAASGGSGAGR